jgi:transcriptional regulator with XRE-family HTH domain
VSLSELELVYRQMPGISRLRAARLLSGLTQAELEAAADLPHTAISHFESGRRRPDAQQRERIAVALDVVVEEIFPSWAL